MRGHETFERTVDIRALLDWWALAGVDEALTAEPHGWMKPEGSFAPPIAQPTHLSIASPAPIAPVILIAEPASLPSYPTDLEAFHAWLANADDLPEAAWHSTRILPTGTAVPKLMVLVDLPELDDMDGLLSGEVGRLFDAMLRAMGHDRSSIYLASLAISRPAGGIATPAEWAQLSQRMRHQLSLVAPRGLLVLGETTAKAMGLSLTKGISGALRPVNHAGGTVESTAAHHPRFLLKHPGAKAEAWAAMKALIETART